MTRIDDLILYCYRTCPFCIKVEDFLVKNGLQLEIVYLDDDAEALEYLYNQTESAQAPCLKIDETFMRESDDIITYLDNHFVN